MYLANQMLANMINILSKVIYTYYSTWIQTEKYLTVTVTSIILKKKKQFTISHVDSIYLIQKNLI